MTREKWVEIKKLFELALACAPEDRAVFIAERCGGDEELRRELESLLAAHDDEFLERPAIAEDGITKLLPSGGAIEAGTRVGAYEIVRELGRGGMGSVYLAMRADQEFQKRVAIKLIRPDMETAFTIRRFRKERQILATLEHPFIARLIDGGTTIEGLPYFVMEYVDGEPLLDYCGMHARPLRARLELFLKVCSAVHYAHRRLIVHRDLKPGNVLVQKDGTPKLLDFGIAKLLDPESEGGEATAVGMRVMTPAYASPEQKRGEPATIQSDVYSLGVILREVVTGRRQSVVDQTGARSTTASGETATHDVSLARISHRATREASMERYESVEALAADIERYLAGGNVPQYEFAETVESSGPAAAATVSVAVLPLRLLNPDTGSDAYLGIGLADAVIIKLSNVARIAVRPTSTALRYEAADPVSAGREMGVDFVLEGRIQKSGNHVRVSVQLVRIETATPVWAANYDEEFEDLLKLEDSISGQVALALVPQLTGEERERLARRGTVNPKAHEAYLRGRWHWNTHTDESRAKALVAFMEAIAEDPQYARAHAGVADYYLELAVWGALPPAESFAAAREAAQSALEIDPSLAEAHAALAYVLWANDRDIPAAVHEFQMAIALNPDYAQAHQWFGLFQLAQGQAKLALASCERARKLAPHSPGVATAVCLCYYIARQYDRAIEEIRNVTRVHGDAGVLQDMLSWCYCEKAQLSDCLAAARRAVEISNRTSFSLCALARAEALVGNAAAARALLAELNVRARDQYISPSLRGNVHLALGESAQALAYLEQAWRERDWWATFAGISPAWDGLNKTPRFLKPKAPRRVKYLRTAWIGVTAIVLLASLGLIARFRMQPRPFETTRLSRITTNGTAARAVISPDGNYVAYVSNQNGKPVVWLRNLATGESRVLAGPMNGDIGSLNFARNGTQLCFVNSTKSEPARGVLYAVALSGGSPQTMLANVPGPISPSVDGRYVAFCRREKEAAADGLYIANSDGSGERRIALRRYPERFAWDSVPAWSPDGKKVAVGIEGSDNKGFYVNLMLAGVAGGSARIIRAPRWQYVERIAWLNRDRGLIVIGQEADSSFQHIWYLPLPSGPAKRINNDLSDYVGVSLTADGAKLVSVQYQTLSDLYILHADNPRQSVQITPGLGRYFDLSWTPDGKIVYASDASGSADIWMMNADGSGQRQLTSRAGRNYSPAVSPDGNWIVFHSNRSGNWNIWRIGSNGADPRALTSDQHDSNWPRFAPDGREVIYHHTGANGWNIWKVALTGGAPVQLSSAPSTHPAVSPRDGRIACWYSRSAVQPSWKLAILPREGGAPVRTFDLPSTAVPDSALHWTPDGEGITYLDASGGVSNLWIQPADGGAPHPLTSFASGQIFSFDWAPDGRIVCSRGMSTSDVVLIEDTGQK